MLFGLQVSARKRYSKLVDIPFEVSNITLSASTTSTARATLVVRDGKDEFAICSLTLGKIENFSTSLHFPLGSEISFTLEAPEDYDGVFHLTGQYIDEADETCDSECGDFDSEGEEFDFEGSDLEGSDLEGAEFDSEEEGFESEEDVVEEIIDQEASDIEMEEEEKEVAVKVPEPKRKKALEKPVEKKEIEKKQDPKDQKKDQPKAQPKQDLKAQPKAQPKPDQSQTERTFPSGLKIKDLAIGKGKKVTQGARVAMQYVGKLTNGNIFDKSNPKSPLKFKMGAGQVIPGMEQGVLGMNYGGKRLITIPPELGYGRKRIGEIPANSTLIFEVTILEPEN